MQSSYYIPRYLCKTKENLYTNVYSSSTIHDNQEVETTQMSINVHQLMNDKQNLIKPYYVLLFSYKK